MYGKKVKLRIVFFLTIFLVILLTIFLMKYNTELIKIKNKGLDRL